MVRGATADNASAQANGLVNRPWVCPPCGNTSRIRSISRWSKNLAPRVTGASAWEKGETQGLFVAAIAIRRYETATFIGPVTGPA